MGGELLSKAVARDRTRAYLLKANGLYHMSHCWEQFFLALCLGLLAKMEVYHNNIHRIYYPRKNEKEN